MIYSATTTKKLWGEKRAGGEKRRGERRERKASLASLVEAVILS